MGDMATRQPVTSDGVTANVNGRERAGVMAFVLVAIAATIAWLGLLGWLVVLFVRSVF